MRKDNRFSAVKRFIAILLILIFVLSSFVGLVSVAFALETQEAYAKNAFAFSSNALIPRPLEATKTAAPALLPNFQLSVYEDNETSVYPEWERPDFSSEKISYVHMDLSHFEEAVNAFADSLRVDREDLSSAASEAVSKEIFQEEVEKLLTLYDSFATQYAYISYLYSGDIKNAEYVEEQAHMKNVSGEVFNLLLTSLQAILDNPSYGEILIEVIGPDDARDLAETPELNERQLAIQKEQTALEQEFDRLADAEKSGAKDEEAMGHVYLDLVKLRNEYAREASYANYAEMIQEEQFGRDYSNEDLENYYAALKEYMSMLFYYLAFRYEQGGMDRFKIEEGTSLTSIPKKYIASISTELAETYTFLLEADLYQSGTGQNAEQVSYTIGVPSYHSALIYQYPSSDYYSISTLIHEFGHFNTAVREEGYSFFSNGNVDLAEIHSQGLEVLFMPYARDIFGERLARISIDDQLINLVYSILTGAMYNEFETFSHTRENLTIEMLNEKFASLAEEYGIGYEEESDWMFYHMYHAPFYYLSYSVSAMAAASILAIMQEDYYQAVHQYLELTALGEEEFAFRETLEESGLMDIFKEENIVQIANAIQGYATNPIFIDLEEQSKALERERARREEEAKPSTSTSTSEVENSTEQNSSDAEETSRPSISLPEYNSTTKEETSHSSTIRDREEDTPTSTAQEQEGSIPSIWQWNGLESVKEMFSKLPDVLRYTFSKELWSDIWSAFRDNTDGLYS